LALVEASVLVKDRNLAAADKVLTGLQSDSPVISLQAVLMRAQMAVTNDDQAQVGGAEASVPLTCPALAAVLLMCMFDWKMLCWASKLAEISA